MRPPMVLADHPIEHRASVSVSRAMRALRFSFLGLVVALAACYRPPPRPMYADGPRGADRDGDGAADIDDACPDDPEDGLPPKANDGCPADDPDQDGIGYKFDKCPYAKEDGLPPYPNDGCPGNDADGDGVADSLDKCPTAKEDNLPPNPSDGCPAADTDHDGIADAVDQCPTQPETWNGFMDEDGCPDVAPAGLQISIDIKISLVVIPSNLKIDFQPGTATLTEPSKDALVKVAGVLKAHPEVTRLEVEAHTGMKGDPNQNLALSEQRANTVTKTLVANGVESARLVPVGYGSFCPAKASVDDVDEMLNRRVMFRVVQTNNVWTGVPRGCWSASTQKVDPTKKKPLVIETHGGGV